MKQRYIIISYVLLIALLSAHFVSVAQMRVIHKVDNDENLEIRKIEFLTPDIGFVATNKWIGYTTDSGRTFEKRMITVNNVDFNGYYPNLTLGFLINGLKVFDKNNLLVYGSYSLVPSILRSTDGGMTFKLVLHSIYKLYDFKDGITDLVFPNNGLTGYAVDGDRILKSTDRGSSWNVIKVTPDSDYTRIDAPDKDFVVVAPGPFATTRCLKTPDGGQNWSALTLPVKTRSNAVFYFLNNKIGWLNIPDENGVGMIFKTTDGGNSWKQLNDNIATPVRVNKMRFINENVGFAISEEPFTILKTTDGGALWEPIPRDNDFSYLGYNHTDIFILDGTFIWAGGIFGFLELNSTPDVATKPKAYFKIDTANTNATGIVRLSNFSKKGYQYQWLLNGILIDTKYETSYNRNENHLKDTIVLIVSNKDYSDTLIRYYSFDLSPVITSFVPQVGKPGVTITIHGTGFKNVKSVKFGGEEAESYTVISENEISAVVGTGASGAVTVETSGGIGTMAGFTFTIEPNVDIPYYVSDTILCYGEKIFIDIPDAEKGFHYAFKDPHSKLVGQAKGTGGPLRIMTEPLLESGEYYLMAYYDESINFGFGFTKKANLKVEHPIAGFEASRVNAEPNEKISFVSISKESVSYRWIFNEDASYKESTNIAPEGVFYPTEGIKTLTLITTSQHGCSDTLTETAVTIYRKPPVKPTCYSIVTNDSSSSPHAYGFPTYIGNPVATSDEGFLICGSGTDITLNSKYGSPKQLDPSSSYVAKYTQDGVLSWFCSLGFEYITPGHKDIRGQFLNVSVDDEGNIYILGVMQRSNTLVLPNGKHIRIANYDLDDVWRDRWNGFILKLDKDGEYLWHSIFDHSILNLDPTIPRQLAVTKTGIVLAATASSHFNYISPANKKTYFPIDYLDDDSGYSPLYFFILNIDKNGELIWTKFIRDVFNTNDLSEISSIGVDKDNNFFVAGSYEGTLMIYGSNTQPEVTFPTRDAGETAGFYLKLDQYGTLKWYLNLRSFLYYESKITSVKLDSEGNSYIAGIANNGLINVSKKNDTLKTKGIYILKFDKSGRLLWEAGSIIDGWVLPSSAIDFSNDKLYLLGRADIRTTEPSKLKLMSSDHSILSFDVDKTETFIATFDTSGSILNVSGSGSKGEFGYDPIGILVQNDRILMTGLTSYLNGTTTTPNFETMILSGSEDAFLSVLDKNLCRSSVAKEPIADAGRDTSVCINSRVELGNLPVIGYVYSWVNQKKEVISDQANPVVYPNETSVYYLTVTNESGVVKRDSVTVTVLNKKVANVGNDSTICKGETIQIGNTPLPNVLYHWQSEDGDFTSSVGNPVITPISSSNYIMTATYENGCVLTDTVRIIVREIPAVPEIFIKKDQLDSAHLILEVEFPAESSHLIWQESTNAHGWGDIITSKDFMDLFYTPKNTDNKIRVLMTFQDYCLTDRKNFSNVIVFTVKKDTTENENENNTNSDGNNNNTNPDSTTIRDFILKLYPNPVRNQLMIGNLKSFEPWDMIKIADLSGKIVLRYPNRGIRENNVLINIIGLRPGYYSVILNRTDGTYIAHRFLKL